MRDYRRTAWSTKTVRWYSSTGQGGGASGGGGGAGGGRRGFFQNFFDNLKKGVEKNQEIQDSLKGFHEERESCTSLMLPSKQDLDSS